MQNTNWKRGFPDYLNFWIAGSRVVGLKIGFLLFHARQITLRLLRYTNWQPVLRTIWNFGSRVLGLGGWKLALCCSVSYKNQICSLMKLIYRACKEASLRVVGFARWKLGFCCFMAYKYHREFRDIQIDMLLWGLEFLNGRFFVWRAKNWASVFLWPINSP